MGTIASQRGLEPSAAPLRKSEPPILPTLFGEGYGLYKTRGITFVFSFIGHVVAVALLVVSGHYVVTHRQEIRQQVMNVITDVSPYVLPASKSKAGGGGRRRGSRQTAGIERCTAEVRP